MAKKNQTATITVSDRPECSLGLKPVINTEDEANEALLFLSFMSGHALTVGAANDYRVNEYKETLSQQAKEELVVEVEGAKVSYVDRAEQLKEAIENYTRSNRPELKKNKAGRTIELKHGEIGWRMWPNSIELANGKKDQDVIAAVDKSSTDPSKPKQGGLIKRLEKLLTTVLLFFGDEAKRKVSTLFTVQLKFQKNKALQAINNKTLTPAELRKFKLRFVPGEDHFVCKPNEFSEINPH